MKIQNLAWEFLLVVILLAAGFVAGMWSGSAWDGRRPTETLSMERAILIIEDPDAPETWVKNALVRAMMRCRRACQAMQKREEDGGTLGFYARAVRQRCADVFVQ